MTPVMADFTEYMVSETLERFEKEEDPQGQGWQKLSPVTQEIRAKKKKWPGQILQVDGVLKNSTFGEYGPMNMAVCNNSEHAAIHNFGGQAGRGKKVTIPKREFLGFGEKDMQYLKESLKDWIVLGKVGG